MPPSSGAVVDLVRVPPPSDTLNRRNRLKQLKELFSAVFGRRRREYSLYTESFKLSEELAAIVGADVMTQAEVAMNLYAVIKERNLLDPRNKQFTICDDQLLKAIGVKRFRTYEMMKHLKDHFLEAA